MNKTSDLSLQIDRFLNKLIFLERRSVFSFKGISLYPSEIHLIEIIRKGSPSGPTAMAEKLGITKGAVSQTLSRLVKKNILIKSKGTTYKNELTVEFTPLGAAAIQAFYLSRKEAGEKFSSYLSSLTSHELKTLQNFLTRMSDFLPG